MLNVDTKLICKLLDERLKKVLPSLVSKNQTWYNIKKIFISEGGKLISDVLEISDNLKIKGFFYIEKTFDLVNHLFSITA